MRTSIIWKSVHHYPQYLCIDNYGMGADYTPEEGIMGKIIKIDKNEVVLEREEDVTIIPINHLLVRVPVYIKDDVDKLLEEHGIQIP